MRTWKFNEFVPVLEKHGFVLARQKGGVRIYKATFGGKVRIVPVHYHGSKEIKPGTLQSMIRKSGLPKDLFR